MTFILEAESPEQADDLLCELPLWNVMNIKVGVVNTFLLRHVSMSSKQRMPYLFCVLSRAFGEMSAVHGGNKGVGEAPCASG